MSMHAGHQPQADEVLLEDIERTAFELAAAAGAEVTAALSRTLTVRYKTATSDASLPRDPVSDVDLAVEQGMRAEIRRRFPGHACLGEELEPTSDGADFVWVIDPIDGTTNFVHAFPLFACSLGVLQRGVPVAGAVWCSSSHELRSGVFHARRGGELRFENRALRIRPPSEHVLSRLLGDPGRFEEKLDFDRRMTGSAAIECAFVAAGILSSAVLRRPHVWDVAGGVALALASRKQVWERTSGGWSSFEGFIRGSEQAGLERLRAWRGSLLLGTPEVLEGLRGATLE
jgi:myo-inositol-1(or 4)-monophosphatase